MSKTFKHAVRDEYSKAKLAKCGFENVINTGCPTTWKLTKEHCESIPVEKSNKVITTITDYLPDVQRDKKMFYQLLDNYSEVKLWIQGTSDFRYFKSLNISNSRIKIIPPKLNVYDNELKNNEVDYVGTRLHAGIRALQFQNRALIIGIDNRAKEIAKDININILHREDIDSIGDIINNRMHTKVNLPIENIKKWKNQFKQVL